MTLASRIEELKKGISGISVNPILDAIDLDECMLIDSLSEKDLFLKKKKKQILNDSKLLGLDFNTKYKSIFNCYCEAVFYIDLKKDFQITDIPEKNIQTPDFKLNYKSQEIFLEIKALSFSNGNLNYLKAQEDALKAQIEIQDNLNKRKGGILGGYSIAPYGKENSYSVKYIIEEIINKIQQNIKEGQYILGDTVLVIDIKQLIIPSKLIESCYPFFVSNQTIVSGVLWNVVFGEVGNLILKHNEFDGRENVEGKLDKNGILVEFPFVKGIIIIGYENFKKRKYLGFFRIKDEIEIYTAFIADLCEFINDDKNFYGFQLIEP